MTEVRAAEKDIGRQMWDLLERKPGHYDVVFNVGVEEVKVKALSFILKAASSVFETEFEEKWEKSVVKDGEGIPLVDVDPVAFQLFVKLLTLDTWSSEVLKVLDLTPNTLLDLLGICRRFQITKTIKNLEAAADEFIRSINDYTSTDEFLELSQSNLATVISREDLPLEKWDVFMCVCRWAELQCTQKGMEKSGENLRSVLGPVLFEIRFPTMSTMEFSKACRLQSNLLTPVEMLATYHFKGMDAQEKQKYNGTQLPFKVHRRKQLLPKTEFYCSVLCFTKNVKIVSCPSFVCDEETKFNSFQISNGRIALHGIGFFGPIDEDSYFDVTVRIQRRINESITIEPTADASTWNNDNFYVVDFCIKGHSTMAVERKEVIEQLEQTGVKLRIFWKDGRNQFAEFLFKKL